MAEGTFLLAEQLGVETVVMMSGLPGGCPEDRTPTWIVTSWPPETEEILRYQWKAASQCGGAGRPGRTTG